MAHTYDIGDQVLCGAIFTDVTSGAAVDPGTVEFRFKEPDSTETIRTYPIDIAKTATGEYSSIVDVSAALPRAQGEWFYRWAGSVTHPAAAEGRFIVRASHFV